MTARPGLRGRTRAGLLALSGLLLSGLLSGVAAADPGAPAASGACEVTILRAPDDVRDQIEKWVHAEPRCTTSLEVRVVPTDGGLYLVARDDRGRLHERVVPDAQSAGVLVASWIADDSVTWAPPVPEAYRADALPPPPSRAPGATLVARPAPPVRARAPRAPSWRWLGVSGLVRLAEGSDELVEGSGDVEGVRVDLDVMRLGTWKLGLAVSPTYSYYGGCAVGCYELWMEFDDVRGIASLSRTAELGRWYLRVQGGAGVIRSKVRGAYMYGAGYDELAATVWVPAVESSLALGGVFLRNWAIDAGPMLTWRGQRMVTPDGLAAIDRGFTSSLFLGLRRRL